MLEHKGGQVNNVQLIIQLYLNVNKCSTYHPLSSDQSPSLYFKHFLRHCTYKIVCVCGGGGGGGLRILTNNPFQVIENEVKMEKKSVCVGWGGRGVEM